MKKIIAVVLFFVSLTVSAQNDAMEDTIAKPAITAIGKPDGEKTEMKIGKEGGSLTSSDGKIKLIIPEGSVFKKTTFSIQPTTNLMPNGNGKSYQMEPSGINFQQPLQIIFYYSDAETKDNSPELLAIAMQNDKGQWSAPNKITTDTVAKIITAEILHFSSYVLYAVASIYPESARLKVNGTLRLRITNIINIYDGIDAPFLATINNYKSADEWSVNGILKGNSDVGLISISERYTAIFKAPAKVPSQNPVAVSVQETYYTEAYSRWNVYKLVSSITIYDTDDYEVKMESVIRTPDEGQWAGAITITDEGSFIVSLKENMVYLKDIVNKLEVYKDDCKNIILNPTTCTGLLHVTGIKSFKVTPANPPGQPYPIVEIWFVPYPMEFSSVKFDCPPPRGSGDKGHSNGTHAWPAYGSAFPQNIKFIAKDGVQIIIDSSKNSEDGYLKVWVKKIKDD